MTKPILKLFRPSGSPITGAFGTPCADTKFQEEPLHRGYITWGYEKLAIFDGYRRLSRKRCEIGRSWLLYETLICICKNRKSWVSTGIIFDLVCVWVTHNPGFKAGILTSRVSRAVWPSPQNPWCTTGNTKRSPRPGGLLWLLWELSCFQHKPLYRGRDHAFLTLWCVPQK